MRTRLDATSWVLAVAACFGLAALGGEAFAGQISAVEFYHAEFNHYFFTTSPVEMDKLDAGAIKGWSRTWTEFKVADQPGPGQVPVYRFFSDAYAPMSSHFFTAFEHEYVALAANPRWTFEGIAFYARLPDATGACPAGTLPIHRGYNNAQGGVPAHRLSPWPMDACGAFVPGCSFEGVGPTGVAFCVPVSPDLALQRTQQLSGATWEFTTAIGGTNQTHVVTFGTAVPGNPWQVPPHYMLDMPYVVNASMFSVAGWDPLASKINFIFYRTLYQFDFDGGPAITGCAYRFEDLFDLVRGSCHPLTGRQI